LTGILKKKDIEVTLAEPVQITRRIAVVFEKLKIPYYVVGSLASSLHGIPRATADVDLMADIKEQHLQSLFHSLQNDFYVDEDRVRMAILERSSFNVIHLSTMFKIDVFLSKNDDFSREEMSRREKYQVTQEKGQDLYLASAEDIILSKLQWYKSGGCVSERQWDDVKGVLRIVDKRLDFIYLQDRAKKRGLKSLLDKALAQAADS